MPAIWRPICGLSGSDGCRRMTADRDRRRRPDRDRQVRRSRSRWPQALGGEIVNADSMQLYVGMDIGTAKPTRRRARRHRRTTCSTSGRSPSRPRWPSTRRWPRAAIADDPRPRPGADPGRRLRAVPARRARRPELSRVSRRRSGPGSTAELAAVGPAALHARLAGLDPAAAASILPTQRPADRAGARGHRADRRPVHRDDAGLRRSSEPVQLGLDRADLDERVERRVARDDGGRLPRRGPRPAAGRPARQPDRRQGAGLRPAAGLPRRRRRR